MPIARWGVVGHKECVQVMTHPAIHEGHIPADKHMSGIIAHHMPTRLQPEVLQHFLQHPLGRKTANNIVKLTRFSSGNIEPIPLIDGDSAIGVSVRRSIRERADRRSF